MALPDDFNSPDPAVRRRALRQVCPCGPGIGLYERATEPR
jgi:hypothetical protein